MGVDDEPTADQVEAAREVLRTLLALLKSTGLKRAVFPESSETYRTLQRGGFSFFVSPWFDTEMYKISKREIISALKNW